MINRWIREQKRKMDKREEGMMDKKEKEKMKRMKKGTRRKKELQVE